MKKSYLTLGALALIMASCSNEVLIDEPIAKDVEIGFATFNNKATKAENSEEPYSLDLNQHHETFVVWGYKNTEADRVFDKQLVSWDETVNPKAWTYTPARFWDKAADKYEFYAAAPKAANGSDIAWTLNGSEAIADQANHYITLTGVRLYGSNLSTVADNGDGYVESFASAPAVSSVKDVDLMIADKKPVLTTAFTSSPVELDFIHILSRFNITIQTTLASPVVVTLKSLEVYGLKCVGDFSEATAAVQSGTTTRWTKAAESYTIASATNYTVQNVASKDKYVLQTLIIPQETEYEAVKLDGKADATNNIAAISSSSKPYIKIVYTIDPDGDGTAASAETYTAYYNLANTFGVTGTNKLAFNEGWMNTLNITIDPTQIKFAGKVAKWDENLNKDLKVE